MRLALDHLVIAVSDWERSIRFYRDVLGATVVPRGDGWVFRFGDWQINVHGPGMSPAPVAGEPVRPGNSDLCLVWDGPISGAIRHVEARGATVELGPVRREGARGAATSIYLRDPDGSLIELMSYDPDERPDSA